MKWFKHYTNAHKGQTLQNLYLEFGKPTGYGLYFLFVGYLTDVWDGERDPEFTVSTPELCAHLGIKRFKIKTFLECFQNIPGTFSEHSRNEIRMKWELNENVLRISFPKLLEIRHRDANRAGKAPADCQPDVVLDKKKNKKKNKSAPKNVSELIALIPQDLLGAWYLKYDRLWLDSELLRIFEYYTYAKPIKPGSWLKVTTGWIGRSKEPVLKDAGPKAPGFLDAV